MQAAVASADQAADFAGTQQRHRDEDAAAAAAAVVAAQLRERECDVKCVNINDVIMNDTIANTTVIECDLKCTCSECIAHTLCNQILHDIDTINRKNHTN